jgi:hypothetical protein
MTDEPRHEASISTTHARQGVAPGIVRWVLWISLSLAVIAMIVVWLAVS